MTTSVQTDALLGQFAVLAYKDVTFLQNSSNLPTGWSVVDTLANPAGAAVSGPFAAFAFRNAATGQIIIAYRGTDGVGDLGADGKIMTGGWNTQFQQGLTFANSIKNDPQLAGNNILVTGHSLGGAIAQIVAHAFGFDGSTIDPGAAGSIVQNAGYTAALVDMGLVAQGASANFTNYLVAGSLVSGATGAHVGSTSALPSLSFTSEQGLYSFLLGLVNPAVGFGYAVVTDQFGNKHASTQASQALNLLAAGTVTGAIPTGSISLTAKLVRPLATPFLANL